MSWFNLRYLDEPKTNGGALGAGLGAIGNTFLKLGAIGHNREQLDNQKAAQELKNKLENEKFSFDKLRHADNVAYQNAMLKNASDEKALQAKHRANLLDLQRLEASNLNAYRNEQLSLMRAKNAKEQEQIKAGISLARKLYPNETANLSDEEVYVWGNKMQAAFNKNKDKDGLVDVSKEFYEEYADTAGGAVKSQKDGFKATPEYVERVKKLQKQKPMIYDEGM